MNSEELEKNKNKKKIIIIVVLIFILIIGIVFGIYLNKKTTSKEDTNIFEKNNEEEKNTQVDEDINQEIKIEETIPEENQQDNPTNEETENSTNENSSSTNESTNNSNKNNSSSNSSSSNNTNNSNSSSNSNNSSSSSNKNNTTNSSNSNNSSNSSNTTETISPVEVTTSNINLNNYESDIVITKGGEYTLTGTLKYSVYINADSKVTLNLNGVTIKSKTDSAIANYNTEDLVINLVSGTSNVVSDGIVDSSYDGCIFSYGELTITGSGNLTVYGNQIEGEGIATKYVPININNGNIKIYSADDGINTGKTGGTISINGGTTYIQAGGDGIDSNKDIVINGGTLTVTGGSAGVNSGLDADSGITINGGTTLALGSDQLQVPESASQYVLALSLNDSISSGTLMTLLDENDNVIVSFKAKDKFKNIIISSFLLQPGKYYLYSGGTNTGTLNNDIYSDGTYTKGELVSIDGITEFVIKNKITSYIGR